MVPQRFHALVAAVGVLGLLVFLAIAVTVKVFYLLTLYRALNRCSPESRAMDPTLVWLNFIPCFSLVWQFFVVINVAKSLGAEFKKRGIVAEEQPGQAIGLAMCILSVLCAIPYVNCLMAPAALVCWIIYWVKIAEYSKRLIAPPLPA
jgi:hypothetical protein